jgi:altronate dehydratase
MNTVWLQRAQRNVDTNLGSVVTEEHTAEDIREEIFTLAWDAAIDAGADEESASAIADHFRKTMGIHL